MNIKQAKQEITNTLKAYLAKDQLGNYLIPTVRQRPVLLMGPPGVGKTQIMEQIAAETAWAWWPTPSPTTPDRAPSACPSSKSGLMAGRRSPSPSTP